MPALHVRNVPEETVARLKDRAAANGRSLEAELRIVLDAAALEPAARKRRQINWVTSEVHYPGSFDRHDVYPDDDDDRD